MELPTRYGIDHNFVVRSQPGVAIPKVASLSFQQQQDSDPSQRTKQRRLSVYSDAPGVQVYTGNYLGQAGNGCNGPWSAICLETQHFPDSISTTQCSDDDGPFWKGKCPILSCNHDTYKQTTLYHVEVTNGGDDDDEYNEAYRGSDTNGNSFCSIEDMWRQQNLSDWYQTAKEWYEDNCDTNIDGVLGEYRAATHFVVGLSQN